MSQPARFLPDGEVLWHGRPEVGLRAPDALAGLAVAALVFAVLTVGLAAQRAWDLAWAAPFAGVYAGIAGAVVGLGRAAGAGPTLTALCAFWTVLAAAAVRTGQVGTELICPLVAAPAFLAGLALRYRQRRQTRYQVTRERVLMGERGRYVIAFPLLSPPRVVPDRFGRSLGAVDFGRVEGTLTTRDGRVFRMPPQPRRFHRVRHPEALLAALRGTQEENGT